MSKKSQNAVSKQGEIAMASLIEMKEFKKEALRFDETTDLALFVRTSSEAMDGWDRSRIVDALLRT